MAWKPAIPEEYGLYFSIPELALIFDEDHGYGLQTIRRIINKILVDPKQVIRLYYKPTGAGVFVPVPTFHLHDVLALGGQYGLAVPPEWIEDITIKHSIKDRRWRAAGVIGGSAFIEASPKRRKERGEPPKPPKERSPVLEPPRAPVEEPKEVIEPYIPKPNGKLGHWR